MPRDMVKGMSSPRSPQWDGRSGWNDNDPHSEYNHPEEEAHLLMPEKAFTLALLWVGWGKEGLSANPPREYFWHRFKLFGHPVHTCARARSH